MEHPVIPQLGGFCPFPLRISPAAACALAWDNAREGSTLTFSHMLLWTHVAWSPIHPGTWE